MTQTVVESHEELTTYSLFISAEEFDDENRRNLLASQCSILIQQPIPDPPKIDLHDWPDIRSHARMDIVNELIAKVYSPRLADNTGQTETISRGELEIPVRRNTSNAIVSEKVAAKLRAKEISAFVPVSATDLVWLEALSMDEDPDE